MTDAELVRYATEDGVARITLDSPHNRNAMSVALLTQLSAGLARALGDPAVRVIVLTGTGSAFCAGADLKEQRAHHERGETSPVAELMVDALSTVLRSPKPVIARINGDARAGGLGLIGACDLALSTETATFAFAEVRVGVVPAIIAVTTLPRLVPRAALELFLTGETFDGRRAAEVGLINRAVPEGTLDAEVERYLGLLRQGAPEAISLVKAMIAQVRALPVDEAFAAMGQVSAERFASEEAREGMRAFTERRPPSWATE